MIDVPTDAETRKPVRSQVTPVSLVCSSCCRVGSAGITAELRTAYANPARDRTARIKFGSTRSAVRSPGTYLTVADDGCNAIGSAQRPDSMNRPRPAPDDNVSVGSSWIDVQL